MTSAGRSTAAAAAAAAAGGGGGGGLAASILPALWSAVAGWGPSGFNAADALLLWQASCWVQLQQQGLPWVVHQLVLGADLELPPAAKASKRGPKSTAAPGSTSGTLRQLLPTKILQSGECEHRDRVCRFEPGWYRLC
jgi:hypothetical protein